MPIETNIVQWGPEDAAAALATQTRNRPISYTTCRRYASDMASGRWAFDASPIRFDEQGHLIDGQHRMTALASFTDTTPDITIPFLVITGLPTESQMGMDQGRVRTTADQIGMNGVKNSTTVAGGVRFYLTWKNGLMFRDNKFVSEVVTKSLIEEWIRDNPGLIEFAGEFVYDIKANDAPPSIAYAAALILAESSEAGVREFFRLLAHGAGDDSHPIMVLDKRLQRHRRNGIKISNRDTLALFIQSWNAWRTGRSLSKFPRPRGGSWTVENFPKPVA